LIGRAFFIPRRLIGLQPALPDIVSPVHSILVTREFRAVTVQDAEFVFDRPPRRALIVKYVKGGPNIGLTDKIRPGNVYLSRASVPGLDSYQVIFPVTSSKPASGMTTQVTIGAPWARRQLSQ